MKREELKKTLKPLIKQCIREVLLEESGVLSKVVTEVARGMVATQAPITEEKTPEPVVDEEAQHRALQRLKEQKKNMLNAIGGDAYNGVDLFEDTTPLASGGNPSGGAPSQMGPMSNRDPSDAGVNLDSIPGLSMDVARKLMGS